MFVHRRASGPQRPVLTDDVLADLEFAGEAEILNVALRLGRVQAEQGVVALPSNVGSLREMLDEDQPTVRSPKLSHDPTVDDLVGHRSKINRAASTTSPDHASSDVRRGRRRTATMEGWGWTPGAMASHWSLAKPRDPILSPRLTGSRHPGSWTHGIRTADLSGCEPDQAKRCPDQRNAGQHEAEWSLLSADTPSPALSTCIGPRPHRPHPHRSSGHANELIPRAGRPHAQDLVPRRETARRSCPAGPTPTPPGRSADRPSPVRQASRGAP
jgi:hypothetical protein